MGIISPILQIKKLRLRNLLQFTQLVEMEALNPKPEFSFTVSKTPSGIV